MVEAAGEEEQELAAQMAAAFLNENLPENVFGSPKAGPGMWASTLSIVDPTARNVLDKIHLEQNEAAYRWVQQDGMRTGITGAAILVSSHHCQVTVTYLKIGYP